MKLTYLPLLASSALLMAHAAAEDTVIFSGEDRFRKDWTATTWGGLETKEGPGENGGAAISSVLTDKAAPWSGVTLQIGFDKSLSDAIPLDQDLKDNGVVVLKLNCGNDRDGQPANGQALKVGLTFAAGGKRVPASPVLLSELGGKASLDGDSQTWEEIRIPIKTMISKLPAGTNVEGLSGVGIQYVELPAAEIQVSDCRIVTE